MKTKICSKCKIPKSTDEFHKSKRDLNGIRSKCKECRVKDYQKNLEKELARFKKYRETHKEEARVFNKKYRETHKEETREYHRKYMKERMQNPIFRLNNNISRAINHSLNGNKNGHHWEEIVGYNCQELKNHLELIMPKEYTWDDYLTGELHLDHIIPISLFDIKGIKSRGFKKCWELENLRLLPASENMSKHNKLFI